VSSLDFEFAYARGELGTIPHADLPQHIRDMSLDGLAGEE
jgi:hypothetical protein